MTQVKVPVFNEDVEHIKELMSFYKFTKKQTTQQKNHLESLTSKKGDKFSIKELKKSIDESKKKELRIIDEVQTVIDSNDEYRVAYDNIISIKGIGQIGAIVLFHLFLKYPDANQRQITSLAGLNPIYRQSGTSVQSKYRISKTGSVLYRGTLFMAVFSAVQYDKNFKAFYERLKEKGKHSTVAQIAVMRKMIITAHSLYKNNKKYDKEVMASKILANIGATLTNDTFMDYRPKIYEKILSRRTWAGSEYSNGSDVCCGSEAFACEL